MIQGTYDDGKEHIHVLSYGGGTQSNALLLMALKGEVNGVVPDYIIFADVGWEPKTVMDYIAHMNAHIKKRFGRSIIVAKGRNLRDDLMNIDQLKRIANPPFYTMNEYGEDGMLNRNCTRDYKIDLIKKTTRELLGYEPRQRVREMVHQWKGISTDEISRVKPSRDPWITAEHPLVDILNMTRTDCIRYVEREGLGTPPKSACIGCPYHDNNAWREMKRNDPDSFADAVLVERTIQEKGLPGMTHKPFLHRSCIPLDEIDFDKLLWPQDNQIDLFENECEGMCGV